jgi:hypothetical protein
MSTAAARAHRRFSVHGQAEAPSCGQLVEGAGFEDAALRFLEAYHAPAHADDAVALIVEDCESGERQCFTVDLTTGETAPCD